MRKIRAVILACALGVMAGAGTVVAARAGEARDAEVGTPLTSDELFALYQGRSWLWNDGSGYFSPRERRFAAWTQDESKPSYALGRWFITGRGKMCFRARWHAADGAASALTCFSHREKDGVVYQKREPDGEWYAFKNSPAGDGDEYARIRPGDYVTSRYRRIEQHLSRGR